MLLSFIRLVPVGLVPVVASVLLFGLQTKPAFKKLAGWKQQIVFGLVFGIIAVMGTEFGVLNGGAVLNTRDAAPLCAGLIFGAPAGVIAGVIGAVERWFSVYWGGGTLTRLACTLATLASGIFGAIARKFMFDDKRADVLFGTVIGVVAEVLHMMMVFLTNMNNVAAAFDVVKMCTVPMVAANALSVAAALLCVSRMDKSRNAFDRHMLVQRFSDRLLSVLMVAFLVTGTFTYYLETRFSEADSIEQLSRNVKDIQSDIFDRTGDRMLELTHNVARELDAEWKIDNQLLWEISRRVGNEFSSLSVVDKDGIVVASDSPRRVGHTLSESSKMSELLVLNEGTEEYVQGMRTRSNTGTLVKYAGVALEAGGFVMVGYDAERFQKCVDDCVRDITKNEHIGDNGYMLVATTDKKIVSDPKGGVGEYLYTIGLDLNGDVPEFTRFRVKVRDTDCYCMYGVSEGYSIIALQSVEEALLARDLAVYLMVFVEVLMFAALFMTIYAVMRIMVANNIHNINDRLSAITCGDLGVTVDVRTNREFSLLSDGINTTVDTLKGYIAEAAARIDRELEAARVIQASSLPSDFPPWPERTDFDIYAIMDPAKEVGGDFYDFYMLDDKHLAFLIADVSGKGITGAMFMMRAKTTLSACAKSCTDVAEVLTEANASLYRGNDADMFVTCWMGIVDLEENKLTFANAGHNPPLLRRAGGRFETFKSPAGFVLAGLDGMCYRMCETTFDPGDEIFIYTDGVTEATDANNALYGDDRLLSIVNSTNARSAKELCRAVKNDVDAFVGEAPQFDDMTMLSLKMLPRMVLRVTPDKESLAQVAEFVETSLESAGVPYKIAMKLLIVVDEVYSNIVNYSGASRAQVECCVRDGVTKLIFTDDGKPYNPLDREDPDVTLTAEDRQIGGLGIFMVKKTMDHIVYRYEEDRNILTLTKHE